MKKLVDIYSELERDLRKNFSQKELKYIRSELKNLRNIPLNYGIKFRKNLFYKIYKDKEFTFTIFYAILFNRIVILLNVIKTSNRYEIEKGKKTAEVRYKKLLIDPNRALSKPIKY